MRFAPTRRTITLEKPFAGQGVSLYANLGTEVQYRRCTAVGGAVLRGSDRDIGGAVANPKTTRLTYGNSPVTSLSATDAGWVGQTVATDIRTFRDNVENESTAWRIIVVDGGGDAVDSILGTAVFQEAEKRDGGVVRIKFTWIPAAIGVQPETFTAIRTAGPSSPASVTVDASTGYQLIQIDTPVLSDASAYTYKIQAANGATTSDILTGLNVVADATGPTAPTVTGSS